MGGIRKERLSQREAFGSSAIPQRALRGFLEERAAALIQ
jgi:hypothetical protein